MRLTIEGEMADFSIDEEGYVCETLFDFVYAEKKARLAGAEITESGRKKFEHWKKYRRLKPWENSNEQA